jgi:hypothetical protein
MGALTLPAVVVALAWAGLASGAPPAPCVTVMPKDDVTAGMIGTGWTVTRGTSPETFDVEVLGIAPDVVAPGHDIIIAKVSGPIIDAAGGGIWAGMSGSPVYVGGDLIGAVALSFSVGPSEIAGLTPAEDMLTVSGYPSPAARQAPARVRLTRAMRARIARSTGVSLAEVGSTLVRLPLPVSVSGLGAGRRTLVDRLFERKNVSAVTYAGSSVQVSALPGIDSLVPGGNFAAALSYGDVTVGAVGTTTYVCDGLALAFGHPLLLTGRAELGAGDADALAIVTDPTVSPFKLANLTGPVGVVDQDRTAGLRAVDGDPAMIPVRSSVTSLDTGVSRDGETDVVTESVLPDLATLHLLSNIDSVFDEIDAGSSSLSWTIAGEDSDGNPWELERSNMYVSDFDLSFDSTEDYFGDLDTLAFNPFEDITFTSVDATATVEDTVKTYEVTALLVCRNGVCAERDAVRARRGQTISLKAILTSSDGSPDVEVPFSFTIPRHAQEGGLIGVGAAQPRPFCFAPDRCERIVSSFAGLLRVLGNSPPHNLLRATFQSGRSGTVKKRHNQLLDRVILGRRFVAVIYPGQCCPPNPIDYGGDFTDFPEFDEPASRASGS